MRRNVFFLAMLMMVSLACSSASAKSRRDDMHKGYSGDRREMRMRMDKGGRMHMDAPRAKGYRPSYVGSAIIHVGTKGEASLDFGSG